MADQLRARVRGGVHTRTDTSTDTESTQRHRHTDTHRQAGVAQSGVARGARRRAPRQQAASDATHPCALLITPRYTHWLPL
jgi:hypothetical protein